MVPTSSTAKLIEKRQQRRSENAALHHQHQPPLPYQGISQYLRRSSRPKSCKYDSYRLRSRISVVEENLFGEPLKNKLMSRSKSMEALTLSQSPDEPPADRLFVHRRALPAGTPARQSRMERPKTALATMRTNKPREPEFCQIISRDQVRSLIVPQNKEVREPPLILTRREFEKILRAAKVMSPSERAALKTRQMEEADALARESELRQAALEAAAKACSKSSTTPMAWKSSLEQEEMEAMEHHILERAEMIRDESLPEVKRLNQLITDAKCQAIRDVQIAEKQKQLEEMAEADRHLEEDIEEERKRAMAMAVARSKQLEEFQENYRQGLHQQRVDQEKQKLLEYEKRQYELKVRKELEVAQKEMQAEEKERKRRIEVELKHQMLEELREANFRKQLEAQAMKKDEERIHALQNERRQVEIEKQREEKDKKKMAEEGKLRIVAQIEQDCQIRNRREEIRLLRQQEVQDRAWREKELRATQEQVQREKEIRDIRSEQLRQKRENAARSVQREREHWGRTQEEWQDATLKESEQALKKLRKRQDYLKDLQAQMEENRARLLHMDKLTSSHCNNDAKQQTQERLDKIRERKLQQLRAYNVPERYLKEIEKKCQNMSKARFTLSYFGKK